LARKEFGLKGVIWEARKRQKEGFGQEERTKGKFGVRGFKTKVNLGRVGLGELGLRQFTWQNVVAWVGGIYSGLVNFVIDFLLFLNQD